MDINQNVAINSLHYFNAHTKNDHEVLNTFIVRQALLKKIEAILMKEKLNLTPRHIMITGSRGMGKSTLLRRLEVAIRKETASAEFIPILFPEEQYNIDRLSKFWINSLDALADNFEEERNFEETDYLDNVVQGLTSIKNESEISDKAYKVLQEVCAKYNRRPVFLIDNFDILFDGISEVQREKLFKIITSNESPIFIGACSYDPLGDSNDHHDFYSSFENIVLERLTQTEMRELLLILADKTGKSDVFEDIYNKTSQLDALHSLTGGNPRIALFIFQLLANGLSEKIFENLNALLDLITPLYKSSFEQLSKQTQIIIDSLALNWDPCDLDQLSHLTKLENNQLSAQLERLLKAGWIDRTSRFSEEKNRLVLKVKNYSIRERFFNIWYIMRRASRRQRGDLKSLTCFLETFYSPQHLAIEKLRIISLLKEKLDSDKITYGLALSRAYNRGGSNELENNIYLEVLTQTKGNLTEVAKYMNPENIPDEIYKDFLTAEGPRWRDHINKLFEQKEFAKARQFILSVLQTRPNNSFALRRIADSYYHEGLYKEAEDAYNTAVKVNPKDGMSWLGIAVIREIENDEMGAEAAYKSALNQEIESQHFKLRYADFLRQRMRFKEAEILIHESLSANPNNKFGHFLQIAVYIGQKRLIEAEQLAIEYRDKDEGDDNHKDLISFLLAIIYLISERYEEATGQFKNVTSNHLHQSPSYWYHYGEALEGTSNYEEAENAYRKVLSLDPNNVGACLKIATFLKNKTAKRKDAEEIFKRLSLLDQNNPDVWTGLAELYANRGVYKKAGTAFKKATQVAPNYAKAWGLLGFYYHYLDNEPKKAVAAYSQCLKIDPKIVSIWESYADANHYGRISNLISDVT